MEITIGAVAIATIGMFVAGAIWYMPLFGNLWGKIHGFDKLSKKEQNEARKGMMPLMVTQFIFTIVTAYVLAHFIVNVPEYSPYELVQWIWIGFFVPTHVSAVLFGGTESKWIVKKILVLSFGSLATLLVGTALLDWIL